ncbi:Uncharacterised protein [Shigella sonnei]|nr:Uncharacterised protein [Shigella sonnei]CTE56211.1 Uncharacterised protein [Shigella sonnei]
MLRSWCSCSEVVVFPGVDIPRKMVIHPIHDGITDLVFQVAEELVQAGELRKSDTDVLDAGQAGLQGGGDVILPL